MAGEFDPYYQWLGIPPAEQPPSHYRLLGLADFETNSDVIENAADRQMAHVRNYQSGKHSDASQTLLNEIAAAKRCLLMPEKKSAYDRQLKAGGASANQERPLKAAQPLKSASPLTTAKPAVVAKPAPDIERGKPSGGSMIAPLVVAIGGGALVLILLVGSVAAFWLLSRSSPDPGPVVVAPGPVAPPPRIIPNRPQPPSRPSPRQPVRNPPNRFPGPSGPAPIVLNPSRPPTPPVTIAEPVGPLRPTASRTPQDVATPPEPAPEVETQLASFFPPEAEDTRSPVPDEADRAARRKQIDDVFAPDKARTFQEKVKVAEELLKTGRESQGEAAAQYALFHRAQEMAGDAGDLSVAFDAIDQLDKTFQVDGHALRMESVIAAASAAAPPAARKDSVNAGIQVVERLFADDRYLDAAKVINALQSIARKTPDRDELQKLGEQKQLGSELFAVYREASDAIEKLKQDPSDAAAATAAGRFFVFGKGDWQLGLPMLAAGDDEALKNIAEQEMAVPRDLRARKELADAWRDLAESSSGVEAKRQNARAVMWYKRIVSQLSGLARVEVDKHIRNIGDVAISGGAPYQPPPTAPGQNSSTQTSPESPAIGKPIDLLAKINTQRDVVSGEWGFYGEGTLVARPDEMSRLQVPFTPPENYVLELEATRVSGKADLAIGLIYRETPLHVIIDGWNGAESAIGASQRGRNLVWNRHAASYLSNGRRSKIKCLVQRDGFVVYCDGREILRRERPPAWDAMIAGWRVPDQTQLSLGANNSAYHFDSLTLTPIEPGNLPVKAVAVATPPVPSGKPVDLLAILDPTEHAVAGSWRKQNGELLTPMTQFARMQIPVHPPEEYDLEIEATRINGYLDLIIGLVYQGRQCQMSIDRYRPPVTQMLVDKKAHAPREYVATYKGVGHTLAVRQRAKIKCEVRSDSVRLIIDGKQILQYTGKASWTGMNDDWIIPDKQALMIGSWSTLFQIHSIKLTPVTGDAVLTGSASRTPAEGGAVNLLDLIDLREHVVAGDWEMRNNVLFTSRDRHGRVTIPYEPPESYRIEIDFVQRLGLGPLILGLVHQGQQFAVEVGRNEGVIHALDGRSQTDKRGQFIMIGHPAKIVCEVTPDKVAVTCNDQTVVEYRGDASRLSIADDWKMPSERTLFIGSSQCVHHVTSMKLTPLDDAAAGAEVGDAQGGPVDLLPLIEPEDDFVAGAWRLVQSGPGAPSRLLSARDDYCEAQIPFIPEGEYDLEVQMAVAQREVDVQFKLPYGGEYFSCDTDDDDNERFGPRTLRVEVRRTGIKVYLDGKLKGQLPRGSGAKPFGPNTAPLRIITKNTAVIVTSFQIHEIGGRGRLLR